ncbi:BP74-related protein [Rhodoglobus sp.]
MKRRALVALVLAGSIAGVSGCGGGPQPTVATFEVAGGEQYKIELATPELIEHAKALLAGESLAAIPNGVVVRGDSAVNEPWSWHIDPATLEFANVTIEVCDGIPQYVEDEIITSDRFCPWSARVVAVDGPGD